MPKIYAIVHPAATYSGFADADFGKIFVTGYHALKYEKIYGYSLGHNASFFSSLDEAKKNFHVERLTKMSLRFFGHRSAQDAIVELEVNNNNDLTGFSRIYTINKFKKVYEKRDENVNYLEKFYKPVWEENSINLKDGTSGALNEINKQYHEIGLKNDSDFSP